MSSDSFSLMTLRSRVTTCPRSSTSRLVCVARYSRAYLTSAMVGSLGSIGARRRGFLRMVVKWVRGP
eukprot:scaffold21575_cov101-Isochrysis_galbana.AAC.2